MPISEASRKWWALAGLSTACLVGYLDFAIVNTALPEIQKELGVSFVELQWVMNVFVLALSVFMVNMGRFGDTFGRRPMLYLGLTLFGIASLFSGLASNGLLLITFRALQGVGQAMILPSSLALISDMFPADERGHAIGIWTSITGLGFALGPVLGGIITSAFSWRWIFFVNIPILIIAAAVCLRSVREAVREGEKKIDWCGFFLMIIGIGTLVTGIIQGPDWGWGSAMTTAFFAAAVLSLTALYIVESKVKSPIIDFKLFASRGFLSGGLRQFHTCGLRLFCVLPHAPLPREHPEKRAFRDRLSPPADNRVDRFRSASRGQARRFEGSQAPYTRRLVCARCQRSHTVHL